ncbi:MAG: biotin--[acetyl-CoA-carboxylase] ligase [Dehalococcoidales bacterium]|nr:biotin--[acetyl-CoA-carboxylase] ligase [Dehalococcoidales bacterium]
MALRKLSSSSITRGLTTGFIGQNVIYHPRLPSTMDAARHEARRGIPEGTVIIAGEQTEGRGRQQRAWVSPSGNIAMSIVLYPDVGSLPYLVMMASLAVTHSIEEITGLHTQIKWPNDILVDGKKVSGILIENQVKRGRVVYALVGIGINVDLKAADIAGIPTAVTSLKAELDRRIMRTSLIKNLLTELERLYLLLPAGGSIFRAWRDRLWTLGKEVAVISGEDVLDGVAESVDEDGALMLRCADGTLMKCVAGDVSLRHNK